MNWDDLRVVAAVANQGSYGRAGAVLKIDETTVSRRVARMQETLGITLFDVADGARSPTAACEAIVGHVLEMARRVEEISMAARTGPGVGGTIRVASTPSVLDEILAPQAAAFLAANPRLTLRFLPSDANVNFSRWETDIAIRLRRPEKGDFTTSRLGHSRLYLFEPARPAVPDAPAVICCYPAELDFSPESTILRALGLQSRARCITESLPAIRALIETHRAVGVMPEHVCGGLRDDPSLRVTALVERQEFWLLVQNHLKRDRATRSVIDWVRAAFARFR